MLCQGEDTIYSGPKQEEGKRDRARHKPTRKISDTYFWGKNVGFLQDQSGRWEGIGARGAAISRKFQQEQTSGEWEGGSWSVSMLWRAPSTLSG